MPKKGEVPTRSKQKFPQDLSRNPSRRHSPPLGRKGAVPTRSKDKFPQNLGNDTAKRFNP